MDQETYDGHLKTLKNGEMVSINGRTALSVDHLNFAIRAAGDTVPGDPAPDAHDSLEDNLDAQNLTQLQELAASLGLTVTGKEAKDTLIDEIRKVHLGLQHKP